MIDFPASPVLNQTFTAPSGVMYKCTSADPVVWTSMATQTSVPEAPIDGHYYARKDAGWAEDPPFPEAPTDNLYYARRNVQWVAMTKAGAGLDQVDNTSDVNKPVSTAQANADSLRVLKTGDTMTGPLKMGDGTVAAPSLTWSAEAGLGVYRRGAGVISYAAGGVETFRMDNTNGLGATNFFALPRAANGGAALTMFRNPAGSANNNTMAIGVDAGGNGYIGTAFSGSGAKGSLAIDSAWTTINSALGINGNQATANSGIYMYKTGAGANTIFGLKDNNIRWGINLAEGGDYFTVARYDASGTWIGNPIQIRPSDGIVQIGPDANSYTGFRTGGIDLPNQTILPDWSATVLCVARGTGWSAWNGAGGWPIIQTNASSGDKAVWWLRHAADGDGYTGAIGAYGRTANAVIRMALPGCFFDFYTSGSAQKIGSATWDNNSDARIKDNITDYTSGLAEVVALRPRTYTYKPETGWGSDVIRTGLIAQEAEVAMPELVKTGKGVAGTLEFDDMRSIGIDPLIYAMVNAIKTLNDRLTALETK